MCHIYTDPSFWFDFDSEVQSVPKKKKNTLDFIKGDFELSL